MTLRRALNTLYAAIVESKDEAEREEFDRMLEGPPLPAVDHRGRPILRRPSQPIPAPPALAEFMAGGG